MRATIERTDCESEDDGALSSPPPASAPLPGTLPSPSSPPQTARRRRSSILKNTNDDDSDSDGERESGAPKKCTHQRRISFTSVDIQEHDLTLGDHPDCSYGPPTALDWTVKRRHSIDIDDYEDDRCRDTGTNPRRPPRQMIINYFDRRDAIKGAGYTDEDIKKATEKKERAKALRKMTRSHANTRAGRMEEFLSSVGRKFKRFKIGPSKKNKKDAAATSTTRARVSTKKQENTTPVAATLSTKEIIGDEDSPYNAKPPADRDDPKKKQLAPASA